MEKKPLYDCNSIVDGVRSRIIKWQRKQESAKLRELKEHAQYKVSIKLSRDHPSKHPTVAIWCGLCRSDYILAHKIEKSGDRMVMISNWTTHVKKCVEKASDEKMKQSSIVHFIPDPAGKVTSEDDVHVPAAATGPGHVDKVSSAGISDENVALNLDNEASSNADCEALLLHTDDSTSTSGTDFVQASPVWVTQEGHQ